MKTTLQFLKELLLRDKSIPPLIVLEDFKESIDSIEHSGKLENLYFIVSEAIQWVIEILCGC